MKPSLRDLRKTILNLWMPEEKILKYDEKTKESWIVVTAAPEAWRSYQVRLDECLMQFEAFKKELAEIQKSTRNLCLDEGHDLIPDLIKELLGEASSQEGSREV